ncbi:MAG: hypothetical protein RL468_1266 [Pseudomonadota bacterium]
MIFSRSLIVLAMVLVLAACSSSGKRPQPVELGAEPQALKVESSWRASLGAVGFSLQIRVVGEQLALASSDGTVLVLNAQNGSDVWRQSVGTPLSAGVGFDGRWASVITRDNELVTLEQGRILWRQRLNAQGFTPPLVAGNRVFVLAGDRSVQAFDAQSGRRLWTQQRAGEPLALRQAGVLEPVGNTLVVGLSGKLVGMDPLNGSSRWEVPLATPRGTNDIERLVDLVGPMGRLGNVVCARAFQAAVGCVDAARGNLLWSKTANGQVGLTALADAVYSSEADGSLLAWRLDNGERIWSGEHLRWRHLGAPLATPRALLVPDRSGLLHFVSPKDGSLLARVRFEGGTALAAPPVLVGSSIVTVSRTGQVQAWRIAD